MWAILRFKNSRGPSLRGNLTLSLLPYDPAVTLPWYLPIWVKNMPTKTKQKMKKKNKQKTLAYRYNKAVICHNLGAAVSKWINK